MNNYQPNLNDPRVIRKIKKAMGFACGVFTPTEGRQWAKVAHIEAHGDRPRKAVGLDHYFGTQDQDISKYLRNILLILHDGFFRFNSATTSKCKEWKLNELGVQYLSERLAGTTEMKWDEYSKETSLYKLSYSSKLPIVMKVKEETINQWVDEDFGYQLTTGLFIYKNKSNRLWNDLQNIPKQIKKPIYMRYGYNYQYDIEACAPTLLYQYAKQNGLTKKTPYLDEFLADRSLHRLALAQELDIEIKVAKVIITSLFSGVKSGPGNGIDKLLERDRVKLKKFQQMTFFINLRKDIKKCWDAIKLAIGFAKMSPRIKWNIYFQLEEEVMNVVRDYLKKKAVRHISEHDGWASSEVIDDVELRSLIKSKTGYEVRFSLEIWN